jgi:hypothetical protein
MISELSSLEFSIGMNLTINPTNTAVTDNRNKTNRNSIIYNFLMFLIIYTKL